MHASLSTPGAARRGVFACQRECRIPARRRDVLQEKRREERKRDKKRKGRREEKSRLRRENGENDFRRVPLRK